MRSSPCLAPPSQTGTCKSRVAAFTFDSSGACSEFVYGGCGATANMFNSVGDCEKGS